MASWPRQGKYWRRIGDLNRHYQRIAEDTVGAVCVDLWPIFGSKSSAGEGVTQSSTTGSDRQVSDCDTPVQTGSRVRGSACTTPWRACAHPGAASGCEERTDTASPAAVGERDHRYRSRRGPSRRGRQHAGGPGAPCGSSPPKNCHSRCRPCRARSRRRTPWPGSSPRAGSRSRGSGTSAARTAGLRRVARGRTPRPARPSHEPPSSPRACQAGSTSSRRPGRVEYRIDHQVEPLAGPRRTEDQQRVLHRRPDLPPVSVPEEVADRAGAGFVSEGRAFPTA